MHRRMRESIKDGSSKNDEGGRRRLTSHGGANNLNLQGVMIWRTFTRNLRHRIQERRSERTAPSYVSLNEEHETHKVNKTNRNVKLC